MATLYRKYRSQRFEDVIGQEPIVTTLTNQIKHGRIGHAYLFSGSRGIGKTTCARIFARAVNCLHPVDGSPCGECEVCKALAGDNVDIIEMDAASNNGVDDARDIREKVKYLPVACKYKVYIIDEVHMLTGGAFNALLKTIEEPPEHVIFILATTEPQKLPQTILSRCIRFDFRLVAADVLARHVANIYDAEGIKYTADAVEEIARLGEGSVRDALSVADTLSSAADVITHDVVLALTGAGDNRAIADLFDSTASRDLAATLKTVDMFAKSGKSISAVCKQLNDYARNVLVVKSVGRDCAVSGGLVNADKLSVERISKSAEAYGMPDISRILEHLGAADAGLKYSVNPRVYLETTLVKLICGARREDDLIKRITALENRVAQDEGQKKNKVAAVERHDSPPPEAPTEFKADSIDAAYGIEDQTVFAEQAGERMPVAETTDSVVNAAASDTNIREKDVERSIADDAAEKTAGSISSATESADGTDAATAIAYRADEGEFKHLSANATTGLELLGKIVRQLRKCGGEYAGRVKQLLARGVSVKERKDAIAFVVPDASYLSMGEPGVTVELNAALDGLGIEKRARIERTADDVRASDIAKAERLFGEFAVSEQKITA